MRICHVITSLVYAGAERLLVNTVNLHARSHRIDVVWFKEEPQLRSALDPSVGVHHVPLQRGCAANLRALLAELRPDVIHTHLGHADFVGLWAARRMQMARFCTMHNIWFKWNWRDHLIFRGYRWLFRRVAPDCRVICISNSVADHVRRRLRVPEQRIDTVVNAIPDLQVDAERGQLRRELEIPDAAFCVLFVGRLRVQKSVDTLIDAAAILRRSIPELTVLIVGDGPDREALAARIEALGLAGTVQLRGVTATPERYFACADAFALPSVFEGFGLVLLEAFRAGLAAVATDIEGPAELISDGDNGLLVQPRQPDQLAAALLRLHREPDLRRAIGGRGRDGFTSRYEITDYAARIEALYQRALDDRSGQSNRPAAASSCATS